MSTELSLPPLPGAPVLITAPTTRCGTTLLQRLLNSSANGVVFGEGVAGCLLDAVRQLAAQWSSVAPRAEEHRRDLARALGGEQFWCPHLLPDPDAWLGLWHEALARFLRFHEAEVLGLGRTEWGSKRPTLPVALLKLTLKLIPRARVLYVTRGVVDVARSAKSRRFAKTAQDLESLAATWRENLTAALELREHERVLFLRLEDVDAGVLPELERFTGMHGLDAGVLATRVNTWSGQEAGGHAPGEYVAPAPLTDFEQELVVKTAGHLHEAYGALPIGPVRSA